jgi:hypothetical protein
MAYKIYKVLTEHYRSAPHYRTFAHNRDEEVVVNRFEIGCEHKRDIEELARKRAGAPRLKTLMVSREVDQPQE